MSYYKKILALFLLLFVGCATGRGGPFAQAMRIDTELAKGVSTRADVLRLLGKPHGDGAALLPPRWYAQDLWFYFEHHSSNARLGSGMTAVDDQVLRGILVFFKEDRYDGHMFWGVASEGPENE